MKVPWLFVTLVCCTAVTVLQSCDYEDRPEFPQSAVEGYVPVYAPASAKEIRFVEPREMHKPGKIYRYDKYLLIIEQNQGIHVFDNSDPAKPVALGFVQLLGNQEMAIRDNVLYANHMGDIVALKMTDFETLTLQVRISISQWGMGVPPPGDSYFECVDPAKGFVVNWKKTQIKNPRCYADYY